MSQFKTQAYNINELTNGEGTGSLDSLLVSLKKQLWTEYENNRIRGTDYANAYIETIKHALGTISQYTLERAKLPLELQMMEAQLHKVATDTAVATKQGGLIDAQIYKEMAQTKQIEFETTNKLPKEIELMQTTIANGQMDLALKEYDLKYTKPEQVKLMRVELGLKQFELEQLKPQELVLAQLEQQQREKQLTLTDREIDLKIKQLAMMDSQIEATRKETELKDYELKIIKPVELKLAKKDLELKDYELTQIKPVQMDLNRQELVLKGKQVSMMEKDIALKAYELTNIKPVELALKNKQIATMDKDIALKEKQLAMMVVEIGLKEKQLALAEKELAIKAQELTLKAKQLQIAEYELQNKLPAEVNSINAQARLYGQKVVTEQAQTSGSPIGTGSVIYHNNKVLEQQAISYKNDAKIKVANIYADMWKTARNTDPDATAFESGWRSKIDVAVVT